MLSARDELLRRHPFLTLQQPFAGILGPPIWLSKRTPACLDMNLCSVPAIGIASCYNWITEPGGEPLIRNRLTGAGSDPSEDVAYMKAVAEAAERYSSSVLTPDEVVVASANELGDNALDWRSFPKCAPEEFDDSRQNYAMFDPARPIRWVRGYSLTHDRERFVPAVITHLFPRPTEAERFWAPISTGTSAHTDPVRAAVSAICEVVERDAISLVWLVRPQLHRIEIDTAFPSRYQPYLDEVSRSTTEKLFFDVSNDIGLPTIYGLEVRQNHPYLQHVVSCATSFDPASAVASVVRELASTSFALEETPASIPAHPSDFTELHHGATYMGRPEQAVHFDFLKNSQMTRPLSQVRAVDAHDPNSQLSYLKHRFLRLGMETVLLDLTTDDVREHGLSVIRAVIPQLMPVSGTHRMRYLAHPRLLTFANFVGQTDFCIKDVNPCPQPFA